MLEMTIFVLSSLIKSYKMARDGDTMETAANIKSLINRNQKPGFFLSNRSDYDWRNSKSEIPENTEIVGRVIDSTKHLAFVVDGHPIHGMRNLKYSRQNKNDYALKTLT